MYLNREIVFGNRGTKKWEQKKGKDTEAKRNDICRAAHFVVFHEKGHNDAVDPKYADKDRPVFQRFKISRCNLAVKLLERIFVCSCI